MVLGLVLEGHRGAQGERARGEEGLGETATFSNMAEAASTWGGACNIGALPPEVNLGVRP